MSALTRDPAPIDELVARARERASTVGVVDAAPDRAAVLAGIGRQLGFPGYYGQNLDALADCLGDLSWLPPGPVELVWADADLRRADPGAHRSVLDILGTAAQASRSGPRPLRVVLAGPGEPG